MYFSVLLSLYFKENPNDNTSKTLYANLATTILKLPHSENNAAILLAKELIATCGIEKEIKATINGIDFHGRADGISQDRKTIFDLKTTAQFDMFKYQVFKMDYDLQAAIYSLFGNDAKFYFVVAETVAPYRVQIFGTAQEFIEGGNVKLQKAIEAFQGFRQRPGANDLERINFNVGETENLDKVEELGDWSNN